ncbi:MAG: hypothetical protein Q9187_004643, partial [Circinaria calcarea]
MGRTTIYTNDPKNYQAVHALKFADYGVQPLRREPTLPFLGEGVFTMDGPFWEHSRAIIRPTFTRSNVANLPAFEVHFRKFLDLIPGNGVTVDLEPLLYRLRGMGTRIQMGRFRFLHQDRKWREAIKTTHAFADKYVDIALAYREEYITTKKRNEPDKDTLIEDDDVNNRYVLLQEIAKETDNRVELRSQVLHVFLAGHDSTAITIGNAIFHLCRYPDKWEKLRAEVIAMGDAPLT